MTMTTKSAPFVLPLLAGLILITISYVDANDNAWRLSKELDGVVVYERFRDGLPLKQFRGSVVVNAQPDAVVRFLQQIDLVADWHYQTKRVELLNLVGMTEGYVHIITSAPWPMKWRDAVCRINLVADPTSRQISMSLQNVDDYLPHDPDYVRVPKLDARWLVSPTTEGRSRIVYKLYIEPGGRIPNWIFNSVAMDIPLYTLINLRSRLRQIDD